jgi:transcription termination factor NusB
MTTSTTGQVLSRELLELSSQLARVKRATMLEKAAAAEAALQALFTWAAATETKLREIEQCRQSAPLNASFVVGTSR